MLAWHWNNGGREGGRGGLLSSPLSLISPYVASGVAYRVSSLLVDLAGLGLILAFHHFTQLSSRFCQIPISQGRIG